MTHLNQVQKQNFNSSLDRAQTAQATPLYNKMWLIKKIKCTYQLLKQCNRHFTNLARANVEWDTTIQGRYRHIQALSLEARLTPAQVRQFSFT